MNDNSLICKIIHDNPENWQEVIEGHSIKVKMEGDLAIFNYGLTIGPLDPETNTRPTIVPDYADPVVQEARGIIIDVKKQEVVCWPFRKFGNHIESYVDKIDWNTAKIQDKLDGCFTKWDKVLLADGTSMEIGKIVKNKLHVEVLSYNFETGKIEPKKVVGWKKSRQGAPLNEWRTIKLKSVRTSLYGTYSQHCIITPTLNHAFFRKNELGKIEEIEARFLKEGDMVLTPRKNLTKIEEQVVLGTLLGDGSLTFCGKKHPYNDKGVRFTHSRRQKEYVEYKANLLNRIGGKVTDFESKNSFNPSKTRYTSHTHQGMIECYNLTYKNFKKTVTEEWLRELDWLGFAIWYMDDGSRERQQVYNSLDLHTEGYSLEENIIIHNFYEKLGFKNYIRDDKKGHVYIHFSTTASEEIWRNIREYICPCMQYKLPERHRGFFKEMLDDEEPELILGEGYIEKITEGLNIHNQYGSKKVYRYDIEIEDNHNYFCQGCLVHNSIIKLWNDKNKGEWQWSTNGIIDANKTINSFGYNFGRLIRSAVNFPKLDYSKLNPDHTYIFELVSPLNTIVVKYPETKLYHLGTRNNITGKELNEDIGIEKPKEYPLYSLSDCIEAAKKLNEGVSNTVAKEGFVVVDENFNRIKIKSPEYLIYHHAVSEPIMRKEDAINLLLDNDFDLKKFCQNYPKFEVEMKYYDYKLTELFANSNAMLEYTRNMFEEYSQERKAVAMELKGHPMFAVGMWGLDHPEGTAKDFWLYDMDKLYRNIPKHEKVLISEMKQEIKPKKIRENTKSVQQTPANSAQPSKVKGGDVTKEYWYQEMQKRNGRGSVGIKGREDELKR